MGQLDELVGRAGYPGPISRTKSGADGGYAGVKAAYELPSRVH
ncbi:MAG: hypothetical protein ACLQBX_18400 [Candidatus Limnocylindrales bacterium]